MVLGWDDGDRWERLPSMRSAGRLRPPSRGESSRRRQRNAPRSPHANAATTRPKRQVPPADGGTSVAGTSEVQNMLRIAEEFNQRAGSEGLVLLNE
jgi:hypothetical protein